MAVPFPGMEETGEEPLLLEEVSGEEQGNELGFFFFFRFNAFIFLKFNFVLLFNYSCVPFLPIPPPHPS